MQQMTIEALPPGYLPCSNPSLVEGYISIADILRGRSSDFGLCDECDEILCEHALNEKREDESYKLLVEHFRHGGMINQPINYDMRRKAQGNGHHRMVAALDAGFTHVPYQSAWGIEDWKGVDAEQYGFILCADSWGYVNVQEIME